MDIRTLTRTQLATALSLSAAIFGLGACSAGDTTTPSQALSTEQVRQQQLGESTLPVWFSGPGAGLLPNYDDRVVMHFYNRIRMTPQNWPFVDMMGNRLLLPGLPPAIYQPFMSEAGRWQATHNVQTGCECTAEVVGYNPMDPATSGQEKYVNASCCEIGIVEGVAKCVGPIVQCTDDRATLRTERWSLLNRGAGSIINETISPVGMLPTGVEIIQGFIMGNDMQAQLGGLAGGATGRRTNAIGISQSEAKVPPPECMMGRENPCGEGGVCAEQGTGNTVCDQGVNPDCLGLCSGPKEGTPCKLPDTEPGQDPCDEENWPTVAQVTFSTGNTIEPSPTLTDGIHYQILGGTAFDETPMGQIAYAVNYYEPSGEPAGTPSEMKVVVSDQCHDLTPLPVNPMLADGSPAPYAGSAFKVELAAAEGCFPYVFVAKDAAGFEYTYPEYGSLQAKINDEGRAVRNDDACPIWVPTRVSLACVSAATECTTGQSRACYTGRPGTQEYGICKLGTEACVNGRWSGSCDGEVTPEPNETCGDNKDNNCNGGTDEECGGPAPMPDMGNPAKDMGGEADMGGQDTDMGVVIITPEPTDVQDDDCNCSSVNQDRRGPGLPALLLGLFATVGLVSRRRKRA